MTENKSIEIPSHEEASTPPKRIPPKIVIDEQPASKVERFRYPSERRPHIIITGKNSTTKKPTYPQIRIVNHTGHEDILIVVSCVTENERLAHPYKLVGKQCKDGIYKEIVDKKTKTVTFTDLAIESVVRKEFQQSLKLREQKKVNPFNKGFDHVTNPAFKFNHHTVRLAFQAFVLLSGNRRRELKAEVSEPISDTKVFTSLKIHKLCNASAPAEGGTEIMLLCEYVFTENVEVLFRHRITNQCAFGEVRFNHKKAAIVVKTPPYHDPHIDKKEEVEIRLVRPSDKEYGEPVIFAYIPTKEPERRRKLPTKFVFCDNALRIQCDEGRPPLPVPEAENDNFSASDLIERVDSEDLMQFGAKSNCDQIGLHQMIEEYFPSDSEQIYEILAKRFQ